MAERKLQEIWGVPTGAPELVGVSQDELEEIQLDISERRYIEARRQSQKARAFLGLSPLSEDVVS